MNYRALSIITFALFITACSTKPTESITPPPTSVEEISQWETSGRVGIRTEDDAISGNFNWHKKPDSFALSIFGPFGQGATKLNQAKSGTVTLEYQGKSIVGDNPATLLYDELGWTFPVEQVTYWIRGLAAPNSSVEITKDSSSNAIKTIEQDGWLVSYTQFINVEGLSLPQKMRVSKPPFRVNLIINKWVIQ